MSLSSVDLLVLGAGWTGTFLLPHLAKAHPDIAYAATTRDGRDNTIAWTWDEHAEGSAQFEQLPTAKTVLIVFPIKVQGGSRRLVEGYEQAHGAGVRFIQLGSTGIFDASCTLHFPPPIASYTLPSSFRHFRESPLTPRSHREDQLCKGSISNLTSNGPTDTLPTPSTTPEQWPKTSYSPFDKIPLFSIFPVSGFVSFSSRSSAYPTERLLRPGRRTRSTQLDPSSSADQGSPRDEKLGPSHSRPRRRSRHHRRPSLALPDRYSPHSPARHDQHRPRHGEIAQAQTLGKAIRFD